MKKGFLTKPLDLRFLTTQKYEIGEAYEIKQFKRTAMMKRPYQWGIAVYQLAKLRVLEFYFDFLDKYFSRQDFESCYME